MTEALLPAALEKALEEQQLAIVVGAGISMLSPSDLPSWWSFNETLLAAIRARALELIGDAAAALEKASLGKIPVVAFSEVVVSTFAGDGYYPLLRVLESTLPNANHRALAALAHAGKITDIITPNFDTLIERAFREAGVALEVLLRPSDYDGVPRARSASCRLHKIHGSVTDAASLIDTVRQKVRGLSPAVRSALARIFERRHVLFLGFSGADFDFGADYLPLEANAAGALGFTWVHRRDSRVPSVAAAFASLHRVFVEGELPGFFAKLGVLSDLLDEPAVGPQRAHHDVAAEIRRWTGDVRAGPWACAAVCLRLLHEVREYDAARSVEEALGKAVSSALESGGLPINAGAALRQLSTATVKRGDVERSLAWSRTEIAFLEQLHKLSETPSPAATMEYFRNTAGAYVNAAVASNLLERDTRVQDTDRYLEEARSRAHRAGDYGLLALVHMHLAEFHPERTEPRIRNLRISRRLAELAGQSITMLQTQLIEAGVVLELSELYLAESLLDDAQRLLAHTIDSALHCRHELLMAHLALRRGDPEGAFAVLEKCIRARAGDGALGPMAACAAIELIGYYGPVRARLMEVFEQCWPQNNNAPGVAHPSSPLGNLMRSIEACPISPRPIGLEILGGSDAERAVRRELARHEFEGNHTELLEPLEQLCKYYHAQRDHERMIDLANALQRAANGLGDRVKEAAAGNFFGMAYEYGGKLTESDAAYRAALAVNAQGDMTLHAVLESNLARISAQLGDTEEATALFVRSKDTFRELDDWKNYLTTVVNHGRHMAEQGRGKEAAAMLRADLPNAERSGFAQARNRLEQMIQLWESGAVHPDARLRKPAPPSSPLSPGMTSAEVEKLRTGAVTVREIATLATVEYELGNGAEARRLNHVAREMYEKDGDRQGVSRCWNNLASFEATEKRWDEAIEYSEKALTLRASNDLAGQCLTLSNLAMFLYNAGRPGEALEASRRCIALAAADDRSWELAKARFFGGSAAYELRRFAEAEPLLADAKEALTAIEHPERGEMIAAIERMQEGLAIIEAVRDKDPVAEISTAVTAGMQRASALVRAGDMESAKAELLALLSGPDMSDVDRATVHGELGNRLKTMGDGACVEHYEKAESYYETAGFSGMAWHTRAIAAAALGERGDTANALQTLRKIFDECPINKVRVNCSTAYSKLTFQKNNAGEEITREGLTELEALLETAIELDDVDDEALGRAALALTQVYDVSDKPDKAKATLARARTWLVRSNSRYLHEVELLERQLSLPGATDSSKAGNKS